MLKKINNLYGSDISIGIEELYKIPRNVYFETVWNIDAKGIVDRDENIKVLIIELKKTFNVFLVSDAPKIWVSNALKEMKLYSIMKDSVICGDGKYMKSLNTQFDYILDTYRLEPSRCISIGDQEESDIIPAKKLGMKTILISGTKSEYADFTVSSMREIAEIIDLNYADMRKIKTTNSKKHHTDPSS